MINEETIKNLIGKEMPVGQGVFLKIHQVKQRDDGPWVTFESGRHGTLPLRQTVTLQHFIDHFGQFIQTN